MFLGRIDYRYIMIYLLFFRSISSVSSRQDLLSSRGSYREEAWHSDVLSCCSEPMMCMSCSPSSYMYYFVFLPYELNRFLCVSIGLKTFLFPCGTLSKIATVATNTHMSKIAYLIPMSFN